MITLVNKTPSGTEYERAFDDSHATRLLALSPNGGLKLKPIESESKEIEPSQIASTAIPTTRTNQATGSQPVDLANPNEKGEQVNADQRSRNKKSSRKSKK